MPWWGLLHPACIPGVLTVPVGAANLQPHPHLQPRPHPHPQGVHTALPGLSPSLTPRLPPGDPAAEEWSQWSVCSLTCGQGSQVRTRSCVSSPYGTLCSGLLRETRTCNNTATCPGMGRGGMGGHQGRGTAVLCVCGKWGEARLCAARFLIISPSLQHRLLGSSAVCVPHGVGLGSGSHPQWLIPICAWQEVAKLPGALLWIVGRSSRRDACCALYAEGSLYLLWGCREQCGCSKQAVHSMTCGCSPGCGG